MHFLRAPWILYWSRTSSGIPCKAASDLGLGWEVGSGCEEVWGPVVWLIHFADRGPVLLNWTMGYYLKTFQSSTMQICNNTVLWCSSKGILLRASCTVILFSCERLKLLKTRSEWPEERDKLKQVHLSYHLVHEYIVSLMQNYRSSTTYVVMPKNDPELLIVIDRSEPIISLYWYSTVLCIWLHLLLVNCSIQG